MLHGVLMPPPIPPPPLTFSLNDSGAGAKKAGGADGDSALYVGGTDGRGGGSGQSVLPRGPEGGGAAAADKAIQLAQQQAAAGVGDGAGAPGGNGGKDVKLTFYKNGFIVNDGS